MAFPLIDDVLTLIFESLAATDPDDDYQNEVAFETLFACLTVNRKFASLAIPLLWKNLSIEFEDERYAIVRVRFGMYGSKALSCFEIRHSAEDSLDCLKRRCDLLDCPYLRFVKHLTVAAEYVEDDGFHGNGCHGQFVGFKEELLKALPSFTGLKNLQYMLDWRGKSHGFTYLGPYHVNGAVDLASVPPPNMVPSNPARECLHSTLQDIVNALPTPPALEINLANTSMGNRTSDADWIETSYLPCAPHIVRATISECFGSITSLCKFVASAPHLKSLHLPNNLLAPTTFLPSLIRSSSSLRSLHAVNYREFVPEWTGVPLPSSTSKLLTLTYTPANDQHPQQHQLFKNPPSVLPPNLRNLYLDLPITVTSPTMFQPSFFSPLANLTSLHLNAFTEPLFASFIAFPPPNLQNLIAEFIFPTFSESHLTSLITCGLEKSLERLHLAFETDFDLGRMWIDSVNACRNLRFLSLGPRFGGQMWFGNFASGGKDYVAALLDLIVSGDKMRYLNIGFYDAPPSQSANVTIGVFYNRFRVRMGYRDLIDRLFWSAGECRWVSRDDFWVVDCGAVRNFVEECGGVTFRAVRY
ncbi:hypothetical protein HK097_007774 [Rhizophlyctis rosea]|uniref:Uncharacterized protein n=1 Tax=Rhizophlyctis rosea TaxID=64517 RepID=A0AAD5SE95_9FUNG|nr:hypothetical protein HK097_007774 [Rhizophlyctis rosea]